jgi:hypothetical protein
MGYVWRNGEYVAEGMDPYGALAAMGGIFTSVEDLATWVSGFLDATPRDGPDISHPLKRATRREMQQGMVPVSLRATQASADAVSEIEAGGYGFGLFTIDDGRIGRIVSHSGGYPGFGSNMRWHAASGLGVIALTNHRYGPATLLARDMLNELVRSEAAPIRRVRPNAATDAARDAVEALVREWDDERAAELFAMNVDLDEPVAERKRFVRSLRERHGALRRDPSEPVESLTSHHASWWLLGQRGRVRLEILLSPELPPKVQTFAVTSVPEPPGRLLETAATIVAAMGAPASGPVVIDWPAAIPVSQAVDLAAVVRSMRATEARFGPISLGPAIAGDGESRATWRLRSARGHVDLSLELDPNVDCVSSVALVPAKQVPPDLE